MHRRLIGFVCALLVLPYSIHLGRGRYTPPQPKFHESVKVRMEDVALKYAPRAIYDKGTETYVR